MLVALLIFLWLLTFEDPDSFYHLTTASFFLIGGLALSFTMLKVKHEPFNTSRFVETIILTALNVVVMLYVNQMVPLEMSITTGILVGIAEECFFTLFLCGLMYKFTNNFIISVIGSSAIWATYHISKYGGNMNVLFVIFLCGCVIRSTFLYSKNADASIFSHGMVNYLALA